MYKRNSTGTDGSTQAFKASEVIHADIAREDLQEKEWVLSKKSSSSMFTSAGSRVGSLEK